jgi:hypothetical protein
MKRCVICGARARGATREAAINDLVENYDYEDTLPSFAELYMLDEFYARAHWRQIEQSYQQV